MSKLIPPTREAKVVASILAAYTLFFFWLACRKFDAMNSNQGDAMGFVQAIWNTTQGRLLYIPCIDMSLLGVHQNYLFFLIVPVYWLVPNVYTILFMQSLLLGISGLPVYLIARKVLGHWPTALCAMIAYLFYPTVATNHVNQIHGSPLALPFLLAAAYFFFERRIGMFVLFAILGMMGQENLPAMIFMFGVYALVRRWPLKWIVTPLALSLGYGLFIFRIAIPYFAGEAYAKYGYMPISYHGTALGVSTNEFLKTFLQNPWGSLVTLVKTDFLYLIQTLQPMLWLLPFFAVEMVLAFPALAMNLLLDEPYRVIPWGYNPETGAFLLIAAVFGIPKIAGMIQRRWGLSHVPLALAFCMACVSVSSWPQWFNSYEYQLHPYHSTLNRIHRLIPPEASVLTPMNMAAHFGERDGGFLQMHFDPDSKLIVGRPVEDMYRLDYVILDPNDRRFPPNVVTREFVMSYYTNANYQLVFNEKNVFVFRHRNAPVPRHGNW